MAQIKLGASESGSCGQAGAGQTGGASEAGAGQGGASESRESTSKLVAAVKVDAQSSPRKPLDAQKPMVAAKPDPLKLAAAIADPPSRGASQAGGGGRRWRLPVRAGRRWRNPSRRTSRCSVKPMVVQAAGAFGPGDTRSRASVTRCSWYQVWRSASVGDGVGVTRRGGEDAVPPGIVGGLVCSNAASVTTAYCIPPSL